MLASAALSGKLCGSEAREWVRSLPFQYFLLNFFMPERIQKPVDISRPDTKDLLKKMRKVDPNQSKRYRQRTGQ